MTEVDAPPEGPAWMLALEKKRQRVHRLAHEVGAGSPCLVCEGGCPGLDLHFWRKLCRNCKCKKEDHDVIDDYGTEQFEILLGSGHASNRPKKAFLDMLEKHTSAGLKNKLKSVAFDWVPPDVSPVIAAEYMQSLPQNKLPISGSDGALYRRQQLERQLPLHDLDATQCHQLTDSEVENLKKYLDNLKSNVVGQGRVTKLHVPASNSLDSLQKLCSFNSVPKPFHAKNGIDASSGTPTHFAIGGQVSSGPTHHLKPPSAFWPKSKSPEPFRSTTPDQPLPSVADRGAAFGVTLSPAKGRKPLPKSEALSDEIKSQGQSLNKNTQASDVHLLKDRTPNSIVQSTNVPGSMWVPVECIECSQKGLNGQIVHDQVCSHIVKSGNIPHQMLSDQIIPAKSPECSGKELDGRVVHEKVGTHLSKTDPHLLQSAQTIPAVCSECPMKLIDGQLVQQGVCTHIAKSDAVLHQLQLGQSIPAVCPECSMKETDGHPLQQEVCPHIAKSSSFPHELRSGPAVPAMCSECPTKVVDGQIIQQGVCTHIARSDAVPHYMQSALAIPAVCSECSTKALDGRLVHDCVCTHLAKEQEPSGMAQLSQSQPLDHSRNFLPSNTEECGFKSKAGNDSIMPSTLNPVVGSHEFSILPSSLDSENYSSPKQVIPRNISPTGVMSAPGAPHMMALYAHNALNSPSGLEPHDVLSPYISSMGIDDNLQSVGLMDFQSNMPIHSDLPINLKLNCAQCFEAILPGEVVVFADRAGPEVVWHPKCFVCNTCQELLVDLVYFYSKGHVYCGRHYAELLDIPRCSACDELIFVKEYTVAEGQAFHVKHFCCFECDDPLGGKQYVPKDDQPVCLPCYEQKYGKQCLSCKLVIGAKDQGVNWKDLNWHATSSCFCCSNCKKSLLGGRFAVKDQQPFCCKECMQAGLAANHQKVSAV